MDFLDTRTAFFITGSLYFLMPLVVWLALREQKNPSVIHWVVGGEMIGLGLLFMSVRGHAPEWLTYETAALCLFMGCSSRIHSLRRELGQAVRSWQFLAIGSVVWLVYAAARELNPYGHMHFIWSLSSIGGFFLWQSWLARQLGLQERNSSATWLAVAYLPLSFVLLLRAVQAVSGQVPSGVLVNDYVPVLIALLGIVAAVLGNTSFLGIFVERASRQQVRHAQEQARREESARLGRQIASLDRQRGMGLMAASLAHELSQPLTNISLISELASFDLLQEHGRESAYVKYLEDIGRNTHNAIAIMERIRGFIKSRDMAHQRVSLQEVHADVMRLMGDWLRGEHIEVQLDVGTALPKVEGDPVQLSQILVNLMRNAAQATAGQTRRHILVRLAHAGNTAILQVQDNGPGFDPGYLQGQAGAFYTTKADGLGVGLSISRHIAEQHGGTLILANAPTGGAQVTLRLPAL